MPLQRRNQIQRARTQPAAIQRASDSDVQAPDFDLTDMLFGFPVAVTLAHAVGMVGVSGAATGGGMPAVVGAAILFVAQKVVRRKPEFGGKMLNFAMHILPVPAALREQLPERFQKPADEEMIEGEVIDVEEDRALAKAALDVARKKATSGDAQAQEKLERIEGQVKALYPDMLDDEDDEQTHVAMHPNCDPLFAALEERPHRLLIGHTGGGKTTLLHELATGWANAGHPVMVCDPDAAPGLWPGCRVVGGNDDYEAIAKVLKKTRAIMADRREQRSKGQRTFSPVHLVIDEVQDVIAEVPGAWGVLEPVLRRGRKIGIHLTLGVQDSQRSTLDLDGKTHLLRNMVVADLLQEPNGKRVARFGQGREMRALPVPQLRDPESLIVQQPQPAVAARVAAQPVQAALGETERLPKYDVTPEQANDMLAAMIGGEPPKQKAATATIERDGSTFNVTASVVMPWPKPL